MAFIDPPHNIKAARVQGRGQIKHAEFAFAVGEMSENQYVAFLEAACRNIALVCVDGATVLQCTDWRRRRDAQGGSASKRAFDATLDDWRERLRKADSDPLGDDETGSISKKRLDRILAGDNLEAAALVLGVVEEFSHELATVVRRFLRLKSWQDTEKIVVGGGLRASRVGELAIARGAGSC
jgi:hypothetical protein